MYESHFQFTERPFAAAPLPASFVPAASIDHARQSLLRCVERAEGVGLAVGPAGTGKSLLAHLLADSLRLRHFQVALLASARLHTRRSLLQNILFELNLPYRGMDDEELRLSLIDHLTPRGSGQPPLVLIVDEAHTLPLRLLEEIRLISNFIRDREPRVRLVLIGGTAMEERLASPKLESLSQRIAVRCYLQPLNRQETYAYVRQQVARVGGDPDQIAPEPVLGAVYHVSDGIPRLINQVCDHALILAASDGQMRLSERGIEQAWADLQQLPAPWHDSSKTEMAAANSGAIEFGQLDEEPGAATASVDLDSSVPTKIEEPADSPVPQVARQTDDASPACPAAMALEWDLDGVRDPFGSDFDEEEVIIDRYASLDAQTLPQRLSVGSVEGQILGQALRSHDEWQRQIASQACADSIEEHATVRLVELSGDESGSGASEGTACEFNPADDPVLPEADEEGANRYQPLPLNQTCDDDRDLIVVQNAQPRARRLVAAPPLRRRQYRQLFGALRRG